MNVISNCCIGSFLYQKANYKYSNPFMWSVVLMNSMLNVMTSYDNIIWKNVSLSQDNITPKQNTFKITIKPNIDIHYIHYILDDRYKTNTKINHDIHGYRIYRYVYDTYIHRVNRLIEQSCNPVFLILTDIKGQDYNYKNVDTLLNYTQHIPYKKFIITPHQNLLRYESHTTHIALTNNPINEYPYNTEYYASSYYDEIMDFIKN